VSVWKWIKSFVDVTVMASCERGGSMASGVWETESLALFSNYRLGGWAKTDRVRSKVCFFHDTGNGIAQKLGKY